MDSPHGLALPRLGLHLSVVIPAYNEALRLPATLDSVTAYLTRQDYAAEVIVVDDGSTDELETALGMVPSRGVDVQVLRFEHRGKGAAVREGLLAAGGSYVLFMDADNSAPVSELERMLPVAEAGTRVVIGSRYLERGSVKIRQPWHRVALSRAGNRLIQHSVLPGIKDTQCGFKIFDRAAAHAIASRLTRQGYGFDVELLVLARRLGFSVAELPISWYDAAGTRIHPLRASLRTLRELIWISGHYAHRPAQELPGAEVAPAPAAAPPLVAAPAGDATATRHETA